MYIQYLYRSVSTEKSYIAAKLEALSQLKEMSASNYPVIFQSCFTSATQFSVFDFSRNHFLGRGFIFQ